MNLEAFSGKVTFYIHSIWYWLIVKNVKLTGIIIFVVGLFGVLTMGGYLVWFLRSSPETAEVKTAERGLNTALIDRLELWIEEVDAERRKGIVLPNQPLFVADNLLLEDGS